MTEHSQDDGRAVLSRSSLRILDSNLQSDVYFSVSTHTHQERGTVVAIGDVGTVDGPTRKDEHPAALANDALAQNRVTDKFRLADVREWTRGPVHQDVAPFDLDVTVCDRYGRGANPAGIDRNNVDAATLCLQMNTIAGVDEARQRSDGETCDQGLEWFHAV